MGTLFVPRSSKYTGHSPLIISKITNSVCFGKIQATQTSRSCERSPLLPPPPPTLTKRHRSLLSVPRRPPVPPLLPPRRRPLIPVPSPVRPRILAHRRGVEPARRAALLARRVCPAVALPSNIAVRTAVALAAVVGGGRAAVAVAAVVVTGRGRVAALVVARGRGAVTAGLVRAVPSAVSASGRAVLALEKTERVRVSRAIQYQPVGELYSPWGVHGRHRE